MPPPQTHQKVESRRLSLRSMHKIDSALKGRAGATEVRGSDARLSIRARRR